MAMLYAINGTTGEILWSLELPTDGVGTVSQVIVIC
jgi:outer membrane protein assembly factor BamB